MNTNSYMNWEQANFYLLVRTTLLAVVTSFLGFYWLYEHSHTHITLKIIGILPVAVSIGFITMCAWIRYMWTHISGKTFILTPSGEVFKVFYTDTWVSKSEMRVLLPNKEYLLKNFETEPSACFATIKICEKTTLLCKVFAHIPENPIAIAAMVNFVRKVNSKGAGTTLDTSDFSSILVAVCEDFETAYLPQLKKFETGYDAEAQTRFRSLLQSFIKEIGDPVEFIQIDEGTEISFV